jgi:hypothetical protein
MDPWEVRISPDKPKMTERVTCLIFIFFVCLWGNTIFIAYKVRVAKRIKAKTLGFSFKNQNNSPVYVCKDGNLVLEGVSHNATVKGDESTSVQNFGAAIGY